jgi:hypothetical protein
MNKNVFFTPNFASPPPLPRYIYLSIVIELLFLIESSDTACRSEQLELGRCIFANPSLSVPTDAGLCNLRSIERLGPAFLLYFRN